MKKTVLHKAIALLGAITMLAGCTKKTETPVADPEQGQTEQEPEQEAPELLMM